MIGLLQAVDERAALDGHGAARGLDPRMRLDEPGRDRHVELDHVAAGPLALEPQIAGGREGVAASRSLTRAVAAVHQPGTRSARVQGAAPVSSIVSRTRPAQGYSLAIRRATVAAAASVATTRAEPY